MFPGCDSSDIGIQKTINTSGKIIIPISIIYLKMTFQPRLETVEMARKAISSNSGRYSVYQLWRRLPKKMKYQTYKNIIFYLQERNEITEEGRKLAYIGKRTDRFEKIGRDGILYNLSCYGYDLITTEKTGKKKFLALEDLLVQILIRYPEARFIEAIPTLMIKNELNKFELYRKTCDYGLINKMGFLTDIACRISRKAGRRKKDLEELFNAFSQKKDASIQYFSALKSKGFLEGTTSKIMRSWNLRGRFSFGDFYKEGYL